MKSLVERTLASMFIAASALVALGACGSETDTTPTYAQPTAEAFCKARAKALCSGSLVDHCYGSSAETRAQDQAACVSKVEAVDCMPSNTTYHPQYGEACINKYTSVYSDGKVDQAELTSLAEVCITVFTSGGDVGTGCTADKDCDTASDLRCVDKHGVSTCQLPVIIGGGLACGNPDQVCDEAFYCDKSDRCTVRAAAGEACSADVPCDATSYCDGDVCVAKKPNNTECQSAAECTNGFCINAKGAATGSCASIDQFQSTSESCVQF